jgi:hypothetical protein
LDGVLAHDAHGHLWVATHELLDEPGKQEVVCGAERSERRSPAGQGARLPYDMSGVSDGRERPFGLRPE